eukprot:379072-Pyramimonas_sp.AAC.1
MASYPTASVVYWTTSSTTRLICYRSGGVAVFAAIIVGGGGRGRGEGGDVGGAGALVTSLSQPRLTLRSFGALQAGEQRAFITKWFRHAFAMLALEHRQHSDPTRYSKLVYHTIPTT